MILRINHNKIIKRPILAFLMLMLSSSMLFAQQQEPEKSIEEIAAEETKKIESELKLDYSQVFYVDSILQHNYNGLKDDFEKMKMSGMQDPKTYQTVRERWLNKNLEAFKKIFTEQQYIGYLKMIGRGKEYKRGKDGLYYLKSELKKKKK